MTHKPWLAAVDHITYVVSPHTIRKWAWYYTEVLDGRLTKKIDDADPTGRSSMMLWEIDFGSFAIALVAGIDREEKSHATVFVEKHGDRTIQHVAFRPPDEDLDGLIERLAQFNVRFQGKLLARQEGEDFVKQIFIWPANEAVNPAESSFDEAERRPCKDSPITFGEQTAADLYRAAQALMLSDLRLQILDWSLMPENWEPEEPES